MRRILMPLVTSLSLACQAICFAEALPVMEIADTAQETFNHGNVVIADPRRLEMGVHMGPQQWGFAFAAFETTWNAPLEIELTGSGKYSVCDVFSIAAISLDYGSSSGYKERHHFGVGLVQAARGSHPPAYGSGGGNNIMHDNLVTADGNARRITIDPRKHAPEDWNGKLWIGLAIHNAGANQYIAARIVNARPPSPAAMTPISDTVEKLRFAELRFTPEGFKRSFAAFASASQRMPEELSSYLGIFNMEEARKAADQFEAADDATKAKLRIVSSQFSIDARDAETKLESAKSLLASWKQTGSFGKELGCILRHAGNLVKVGVHDLATGNVIKENPDAIELSAARREHEGFQLVLTPLANGTENIRVSASDLASGESTISRSGIRIHAVGFTRVFEGRATQVYQPDPFLPEGEMPVLKPGRNQSYWISVKVPDDAPAGLYKGMITVSSADNACHVPVSLRVRNFEIPKRISLRSSFWMFRDQINRFYSLDEVGVDDYMKWIDMALEYRLNPIDTFEGRCIQYLDILKTNPLTQELEANESPDWSKWDRYVDHMLKGGANTIHLGVSHHQGTFFSTPQRPVASPGQIAEVRKSIEIARRHYKDRGIYDLHYMQLRDETSEPAALDVYKAIHKDMPDVKLLLTAPSKDARQCLRIPCPLSPEYNREWRDEVVANGGEYWWYVCVGPSDRRYANLFIDQKAVQHRALWWQTWNYKVDGLLYWGLNFYGGHGNNNPQQGGLKSPSAPMPDLDHTDFSPVEDAPGDGFSIYPGATPDKPLPSIRLEIMRDGEEDYEYLVMLEKLINSNQSDEHALAAARKAIRNAKGLTTGLTKYELDESEYQRIRNEIAEAIEGMVSRN
jgi:hypothetical protein